MNIPAPWSISAWVSFIGVTVQVRTSAGSTVRIQEPKDWPPTAQGWDGTADEKKWCLVQFLLNTRWKSACHWTVIYTLRRYNYILITILITILLNMILLIIIIIIFLYLYMTPLYDYIILYTYALDCTFMKMIIDDVIDPTLKNA